MISAKILVYGVALTICIALSPTVEAVGYGEDCNDTDKCDTAKFLMCDTDSKKCKCDDNHQDDGNQKCLANVGEICTDNGDCNGAKFLDCDVSGDNKQCKCKAGTEEDADRVCVSSYGQGCGIANVPATCASYMNCDTNKCVCNDGLVENGNGKCRAELGATCGADLPCDDFSNCPDTGDKKCVCNAGLVENENGKCRAGLGATCGADLPCDDFSNCPETGDKKCVCNADLVENENGKCRVLVYESTCSDTLPCDEGRFLACEDADKKCRCMANHTVAGTTNKKCLANLGDTCDDGQNPIRECDTGKFLDCDVSGDKQCKCKAGTEEDADRVCVSSYGQGCGIANVPATCASYMNCDTNKCVCNDGLVENGNGKCRAELGATCGADLPCDDLSNCPETGDKKCVCNAGLVENENGKCRAELGATCGANLPCDDFSNCPDTGDKKCVCNADLVENENGKCRVLVYESTCSDTLPCDEGRFLACEDADKKCRCMANHTVAGTTNKKCLANLGDTCDDGQNPIRECDTGKFVTCGGTPKVCGCRAGTADVGGLCKANYNGSCTTEGKANPTCNNNLFLSCQSNFCKCNENTVDVEKNCKAAYDKPCNTTNAPKECAETNNLICQESNKRCICMTAFPDVNEKGQCNGGITFAPTSGYIITFVVAIVSAMRM